MLLTPDSTFGEPLSLQPTPTPDELFQLGMEHLRVAVGHFSAAGRLAGREGWAWTRVRALAIGHLGRERGLDAWARLGEAWALVRALFLDLSTLFGAQAHTAWVTLKRTEFGVRVTAASQRGLIWARPYASRFARWRVRAGRVFARQSVAVLEAVRAELTLTLGLAPQALAWGGSVALPRQGARPLNRRQAAEQRQRRWLLTLIVADAILIVALLQVADTAGDLARPRDLSLEGLRPLRLANARAGGQIRGAILPLPAQVEPTVLPTATWEPVLTATPILTNFGVMEPVLPGAPGYFGPGACELDTQYGQVGSGAFIWPADDHFLSGYDYSWRHPGLDFSAMLGASLYAVDHGQVVYAGWNNYGYGNFLVLDHGNGWFSAYAHLSQFFVSCRQSVTQGQVIGAAGSTGNSTGPHLHFELFQTGVGQINPWTVLP